MATVNIYLTFNGNCEEAFKFYKSVFGGDFSYVGRYKDVPSDEDMKVSKEDEDKIMHISLPISKETMLMGSDVGGEWAKDFKKGNNFSISITIDSKEKADKYYKELSEGGEKTMPMDKTFWDEYFGMLTDKFGINWMVSFREEEKK